MASEQNRVGQHIRNQVIPPGMSVKDAAARLGVGRPALSNLLNGKASLSQKMALRLERAFGANREELLALQAACDRTRRGDQEKKVAVRGYVPSFLTLKAHDIERWAETTAAREHLPVLLRKLVHGTGRDLKRVDFPGFDNSQRRGWDGWVEAETATAWIPEGISGWEFGTSQNPRRKAERDYIRRLQLPAEERKRCAFVFVTPRNWPGKNEWAKQKEASGDGWREVRAYDASDLEQWLEESVIAPVWLAEKLPMPIEGVKTLDAHWDCWAKASEPPMTENIFESTISACIKQFKKWLEASPERPFVVAADSKDEALAFLGCLFRHEGIPVGKRDLAAVFESSLALTTLAASSSPFIPIAANAEVEQHLGPLCKRMHCIATCPRNAVEMKPDVALELLGYEAFKKALEEMGLDRRKIERLGRESGRSPTILRRRLSSIPAIRKPQWANDTTLVPMCMVGAWHSHSKADKEVIQALANCEYEEVEENVARLQQIEDSPVWSVGQHRGVKSKIDSLFSIAPSMTEQDIHDFLKLAEYVLSESDPALELPETEQWAAAIHDKVRDHSTVLRDGVRETLVLLSVHGNDLFQKRMGIDVAALVSSLIDRLLMPLEEKLQSQEGDLPAYAEAAPDRFLAILEEDLKKDKPAVLQLLKPASSHPFGHCSRTGLLWALECVAWNPDHLSRVCILLAELSKTEIKDNWVDNPFASLAGILRSWMPQTAASVDERAGVLKMLTNRFPDIGWQLCLSEISVSPRSADNYRPRWRSDATGAGGVATRKDFIVFIRCAADLMLNWPKHDQTTLGALVDRIEALDEKQKSAVWDLIDAWARHQMDEEAKAALRERIRRSAFTKRVGHNCKSTIDKVRLAYERLRPHTPAIRHAWLFANSWVEESRYELMDKDFEAREARIDNLRQAAIREIWEAQGLTGILKMVENGGDGHTIGRYAATCTTNVLGTLLECLSSDVNKAEFDAFMQAFIVARADPANSDLLLEISCQVEQEQLDRLWQCAPFKEETWRLLDHQPEDLQTRYWREVFPFRHRFTESECTEIVERLLAVNRPRTAFTAMKHQWKNVETTCLRRLLAAVISGAIDPKDAVPIASWNVSEALNALGGRSGVTVQEMAQLEFAFIGALDHSTHGIPNLERMVAESPTFFVEAISRCFKRRDGGQDPREWRIENETHRRNVAKCAYDLLNQVTQVPGTEADGSINLDALLHWLKETRQLCAKIGRVAVGDLKIGELLSRAPADEDGAWPCDPVCKAIEAMASEDIARGFIIGKCNARGVSTRNVGEGGNQERELATKYRHWAKLRRVDYPFTSRVINRIAESYDDDAEREDARVALEKHLNT